MKQLKKFWQDTGGDAAVEATILFPIMILIFAGLVLLAMYLPARAALQRAAQYAATAIASERSDTWLFFDEYSMSYYREDSRAALDNVYISTLDALLSGNDEGKAEAIVANVENKSIITPSGTLDVEYGVVNYVIYKEIVITATRTIQAPEDLVRVLSLIQFPDTIPITVTATAIVQNGDEFVRNIDIAVDFVEYIDDKLGISSSEVFQNFGEIMDKVSDILGI